MKQKIIGVIIFIVLLVVTNSGFSQSKTIEDRLGDLEKRIQALESKLGTSQTPSKSATPQITEEIISTAIKEELKKEVPGTWAGSLMGGKNAVIEKIEIKQIGNYNEQGKYWPVKCRVKGKCEADFLTEKRIMAFDKIGDFKIKQDDYGKWYSELDTF